MKINKTLLLLTVTIFYCYSNIHGQGFTWMKSFGGSNHENLYKATIDHNNDIYITGAFQGSIDVDPGDDEFIMEIPYSHFYDTYMVKLNSDGELIHAHSTGSIGADFAPMIYVDESLNYYISGTFANTIDVDPGPDSLFFTANIGHDIFFQKFNETNQLQWAFHLETYDDDDELSEIAVDEEGNIYITGDFTGTVDFNPGEAVYELTSNGRNDIFIMKLDSNGNLIWVKNIGSWYEDYGQNILVTRAGNLLITGSFIGVVDFDPGSDTTLLTSAGSYDSFFLNLTSDGEFNWVKQIGGIAGVHISVLKTDNDDNIIVGGNFRFQADFNPDPDEEYLLDGGSSNDLYVLKLNENGIFQWVSAFNNSSTSLLHTISIDSIDNVYFASNFSQPIDIISGDSSYIIDPVGNTDFFIEKLNSSGEFVSAIIMGSEYYESINTIILDNMANIFTVGYFGGNPEYNLNNTSASVTSAGSADVFIQKIYLTYIDTTQIDTNNIIEYPKMEISIYPNPNNGNFMVQSSDLNPGIYNLKIINCIGQSILEKRVRVNSVLEEKIHISGKGAYLIEISDNKRLRIINRVFLTDN